MSGAFYEFEGVHGLVDVLDGGGDVAQNEGEGVARQGVLEQSRQFGLAERSH